MKVRRIVYLYLLAVAALPQLAQAESRLNETRLNVRPTNGHQRPQPLDPQLARALGATQSVFDFCSRVDPTDHAAFDRHAKALFDGMSEDRIGQARASDPYQKGYGTLQSVLAKFTAADAVQGCKGIL
ncbi:MAG TPA: hypothetical protein VH183_06610 [Burkholderiaceae bacterium]|jgi:hypothetical protein|nr:hypothetical protein [Burkholderiaceae bacterium]